MEKNLDPNQNTIAIMRFLKILDNMNVQYQAANSIVSIGALAQERIIEIDQETINKKLGVGIHSDLVIKILTKLGFGVIVNGGPTSYSYSVTVPTFRGTKDITIAEDIIEEIGRFYGYTNIPQHLPMRQMATFNINKISQIKKIKQQLAFGMDMHELYSYAFYDEEFLKKLNFDPEDSVYLENYVSENYKRLVTSLIPHLLKAVVNNNINEQLRFFELAKTWRIEKAEIKETSKFSGIISDKSEIAFYEIKAELENLFRMMNLNIVWTKPTKVEPFFDEYQVAQLNLGKNVLGLVGKVSKPFINQVAEVDAFIFELDLDLLLNFEPDKISYKHLSKFPEVDLDISVLVPLNITVEKIQSEIFSADPKIKEVRLIDHFNKPEWKDQKSLTLRFIISDPNKTMTKEEIDAIYGHVAQKVKALGAQIR